MKHAVIDIGTNTILCLVVERSAGGLRPLCDLAEIPRLGEGLSKHKIFSAPAIERAMAVLKTYHTTIRSLNVPEENVTVLATAGMRRARNAASFIDEVKKSIGFTIEIISGETEALFAFRAVQFGLKDRFQPGEHLRIFDIGGGSTEIIEGTCGPQATIASKESLALGSVWLHEYFLSKNDPPDELSYKAMLKEIDGILASAKANWPQKSHVVGMAGTVTSIGAMSLGLTSYDPKKVHGLFVETKKVREISDRLRRAPTAERIRLAGLQSQRADIIVAGAAICCKILEHSRASGLWVSDQGIRHGCLYDRLAS